MKLYLVVDSNNAVMGIYSEEKNARMDMEIFEGTYKCRICITEINVWSAIGHNIKQ